MHPVLALFIVACAVMLFHTIQAGAIETFRGKAVGIIIEKSCLVSTKCLDYSDIMNLDNSNPVYAGKFIEKNGDVVRTCTSKQNNHQWLRYANNYTIMVDPCIRYQNQIQTISIISRLDEYHIPGQDKVVEGKSLPDAKATKKIRSYSHTRYVDATCTHGIITAKDWQAVLPDTILYMKNNCDPNYTRINTVSLDIKNLTKHDISTSQKWKDEKRLDWIKTNCLKTRNACGTVP